MPGAVPWAPGALGLGLNEPRPPGSPTGEGDMSDTVEDTKRKLQELEQRIRAAKSSLGAKGEIVSEAQKQWDAMLETHADLRRKLEAAGNQSGQALDGISLDVDVLRNSFEQWMARVEGDFDNDSSRKGR